MSRLSPIAPPCVRAKWLCRCMKCFQGPPFRSVDVMLLEFVRLAIVRGKNV